MYPVISSSPKMSWSRLTQAVPVRERSTYLSLVLYGRSKARVCDFGNDQRTCVGYLRAFYQRTRSASPISCNMTQCDPNACRTYVLVLSYNYTSCAYPMLLTSTSMLSIVRLICPLNVKAIKYMGYYCTGFSV